MRFALSDPSAAHSHAREIPPTRVPRDPTRAPRPSPANGVIVVSGADAPRHGTEDPGNADCCQFRV